MTDHFERLGLPRRFSVDPADLERAYLAASRAVHPDFHLTGGDAQLDASVEASASVNEAYTTLRDPFTRAEYLLSLEAGPTAAEVRNLPPAFLAEMLEAREDVETARGDPAAAARLDAEFAARYQKLLADVEAAFEAARPGGTGLRAVRELLNAANFVRGLIRDLHAD